MMTKRALFVSLAVIVIAMVWTGSAVVLGAQQAATSATAVAIDGDDIGGVVSGPNGPEAGVWVIAETTDLPTKFARIVVTDDQGRYVVPDLPKAKYQVWVRGYGLVDTPKVAGVPGQQLNLRAVPAPDAATAARYYPAIYWYSMLKIPGRRSVRRQERHPCRHHPERLPRRGKEPRVRRLPPTGSARHPHDPGAARRVRLVRGGVDPPRAVRTGGAVHDHPAHHESRGRAVQVPRRLDRPRREGRAAAQHAAPPPGRRAQHRRDDMRVGRPEQLPPRPDRHRPALPDGQRLRPAVRLARVRHRRLSDPGSEDAHRDDLQGPGARRRHAGGARARARRSCHADGTLTLLGRREDLGHEGQQPQRHDRPEGARMVRGRGARPEESGLLQEGLGPSLRQALPAGADEPADHDARPEDDEVHLRRHLLPTHHLQFA